jgi:hypothetical protein
MGVLGWCACAALLAASTGCEALASVDLHYVDGGTPESHPSSSDGVAADDADAIGQGGLCGCDLNQGEGCCIPKGSAAAFCTMDGAGCVAADGLYIGCQSSTMDSTCCWTTGNASGAGAQLAFRATCGADPAACTATSDCSGAGACELATCGGVTVGACGVTPVCP